MPDALSQRLGPSHMLVSGGERGGERVFVLPWQVMCEHAADYVGS